MVYCLITLYTVLYFYYIFNADNQCVSFLIFVLVFAVSVALLHNFVYFYLDLYSKIKIKEQKS